MIKIDIRGGIGRIEIEGLPEEVTSEMLVAICEFNTRLSAKAPDYSAQFRKVLRDDQDFIFYKNFEDNWTREDYGEEDNSVYPKHKRHRRH